MLEKLLEERGMKGLYIKDKLGLTHYKFSAYKKDITAVPLATLCQLADLFDIDQEEFVLMVLQEYRKKRNR